MSAVFTTTAIRLNKQTQNSVEDTRKSDGSQLPNNSLVGKSQGVRKVQRYY